MTEIRALVVDDEPLARRGIRQLLAPHADIVVVGECRDGLEALRALATVEPDLVFLDVQMPGLDGFGVIRLHGADRMPATVFVTAHDEFAVSAFEAQALDYLVKPLSEARFRATVARVRERMRLRDVVATAAKLSALLADTGPQGGGRPDPAAPRSAAAGSIAVRTDAGERFVEPGEIDWIEARDDHVAIHAGPAVHLVRGSLSALERVLDPARFVRIHRSAIVPLDRVREWAVAGERAARVVLRDGTELPVSRRRIARVKAMLRAPFRRR